MDRQLEKEFLLHVAAGTDPLTALASLPREDESSKQPASASDQWFSAIAWIVVAGVSFALLLLFSVAAL